MPELQCPKCEGEMEQGYIHDWDYTWVRPARWEAGPPQKRMTGFGRLQKVGKTITAYRCTNCGYLELYAR